MATFSISDVRENLADAVAKSAVEEVFLEKHGKVVAVMISAEVYEKLMDAWEDIQDLKMLEELEKSGELDAPGIPMEQVFRELGLS
jgi:PHD/YefM family antitoxin component YafN of YafNO toxin-antitoxin module